MSNFKIGGYYDDYKDKQTGELKKAGIFDFNRDAVTIIFNISNTWEIYNVEMLDYYIMTDSFASELYWGNPILNGKCAFMQDSSNGGDINNIFYFDPLIHLTSTLLIIPILIILLLNGFLYLV